MRHMAVMMKDMSGMTKGMSASMADVPMKGQPIAKDVGVQT